MSELVRAPFPWFGGKRKVAPIVWNAFGGCPNYIEPFAGSLAVLLGRPGGAGKIETVNDRDRYLANFWRAVIADPYAVAAYADNPVNEADLHATHRWLVNQAEFRERMHTERDFHDAEIAGLWVWGICQWIGSGWCAELTKPLPGGGRPHLASEVGVHRKLPHLAVKADGACAGRGIHSDHAVRSHGLPSLGNDRGVHGVSTRGHSDLANYLETEIETGRAPPAFAWFLALADRMRRVRVACGDWQRVLGASVLGKGRNVGGRRPCAVFLDPPYDHELRDPQIYAEDDPAVAAIVRAWAIEHGNDRDLRIALCGYEGEHEMPADWVCHEWKAARGYAGAENENRSRERIWFSPHCLDGRGQGSLF